MLLKQLEDALVLVGPAGRLAESVILHRIDSQFPVLFAQLNELLHQTDGVDELYVGIHHAMRNQQVPLQTIRKVDGGRLFVGFGIALRLVQNIAAVLLVVIGPVAHGAQRRAGGENIGLREHGHQGDESAVAAAVDTDLLRIHTLRGNQPFRGIHFIGQVHAAHMAVDGGAPVAPITFGGPVIDFHHHVAVFHQEVMEQVELQVYQVLMEQMVHQAHQVVMEQVVHQVLQEQVVVTELQVLQVQVVLQVLMVQVVLLVQVVLQEVAVHQVLQEARVLMVHQEQMERMVQVVLQELTALQVQVELMELRVHQDLMVTNILQHQQQH